MHTSTRTLNHSLAISPVASPSIAFVQDALPFIGGAERVLESALEIYPSAPIYTLLYNRENFKGSPISEGTVHTSFIGRLPWAAMRYRDYLPLYPLAIEQFDLRAYDLILSFSYAVAHGVIARPDQFHISYTFTPIRQAWHFYHEYLQSAGLKSRARAWLSQAVLHYLRLWDRSAADRVDYFIAPSEWTARCLWRAYRRESQVLYPPVDIQRFSPASKRADYYLTVSRMVKHKKVDLIVEAFTRLGYPLVVVGDGPEFEFVSRKAPANVHFLGRQTDAEVAELMGRAKATVHMAEEDFGIALVEAQAAGSPVIAFRRGGAAETVLEGETGLLFDEQSPESLMRVVEQFEDARSCFDPAILCKNAERFAKEHFQRDLGCLVEREWTKWRSEWKAPV